MPEKNKFRQNKGRQHVPLSPDRPTRNRFRSEEPKYMNIKVEFNGSVKQENMKLYYHLLDALKQIIS